MNKADKFKILRIATDITFPKWGAWLYDTWANHNRTYFDSQLSVVPIYFGWIAHGHSFGAYHADDAYPRITIQQSVLDSSATDWQTLPLLGQRFVSDVLLHEMMHQAIYETRGHNGPNRVEFETFTGISSHNNPAWCDEISRLAPLLGLGAIHAKPIKRVRPVDTSTGKKGDPVWFVKIGYLNRVQLVTFPHCLTSEAYYRNETDSRSLSACKV